jgi:hypothetical protein
LFTIKLDYSISEVGYDSITKLAKNISPEGNKLRENFYVAKFMMKPLGQRYQKIDMCPNLCMKHYNEDVDLTEYKTCGYALYKSSIGRVRILVVIN